VSSLANQTFLILLNFKDNNKLKGEERRQLKTVYKFFNKIVKGGKKINDLKFRAGQSHSIIKYKNFIDAGGSVNKLKEGLPILLKIIKKIQVSWKEIMTTKHIFERISDTFQQMNNMIY
jgi:hypothetical protein